MIRTLIGGIAVGIANIIPGVSGGTMMVILGVFNRVSECISGVFKPKNDHRKEDIIFLIQLLIGAGIGLIGFAKVLTYLFNNYPTQTMFWFVGLVLFSIPIFIKSELKKDKINKLALVLGVALIFIITFLNPGKSVNINPEFPSLNIFFLLSMIVVGFIGGFSMFLPGVSGSMVLLIIGQYHLFKAYLANVMSFRIDILLPLCFMGLGIVLGIVAASALITVALKKNHAFTVSFLLGLILASSIVLIPIDVVYTLPLIATSALTFIFGGVVVALIDKFS
ncbi:MAG: DUF368 domain-containing protein [Erysipelotrichaceae bacterium]